jgi:predicted nucleic acid-binding protein
MGAEFLIDTNVVIASLGNQLPTDGVEFLKKLPSTISIITQIELLGWPGVTPETLTILESYIERSLVYPLTPSIVDQCVKLRRIYKIKIPDAIIAATALVHNLTLLTRNIDDFKKIADLEMINPFELDESIDFSAF